MIYGVYWYALVYMCQSELLGYLCMFRRIVTSYYCCAQGNAKANSTTAMANHTLGPTNSYWRSKPETQSGSPG